MKKLGITLAVVAFAAVAAQAQTTSANIVGYVKNTSYEGLQIFTVPFTGSTTVAELFGGNVPVGTSIYAYNNDGSSAGYASVSYTTSSGFVAGQGVVTTTNWNGTLTLESGTGYWIQIPGGSAPSESISAGEVNTSSNVVATLYGGLNLVANPYPVATQLSDFGFYGSANVGDTVYVYSNDGTTEGYASASYATSSGFVPGQGVVTTTNWNGSVTVDVGQGFWYQNTGSDISWTETKNF